MKINNNRELQNIVINHSADIHYQDFILTICVQSISDGWISSLKCLLIMLIDKVSLSSFRFSSTPCIRRQFCLEYSSCSSPCTERLLTLSVNSVTCVWTLNLCQFNCLSGIDGLILRVQVEHEKPKKSAIWN